MWKGHPMRLELTRVGLLVELAHHYTTKGAFVRRGVLFWSFRDLIIFRFTDEKNRYNFESIFNKSKYLHSIM